MAPTARSGLLRWGGFGAVLAGVLFGVWGYVHRGNAPPSFDAAARVLAIVVPALFMATMAALYARCSGQATRLAESGIILGLIASATGTLEGLMGLGPWHALDAVGEVRWQLWVWLPTLFGCLLATGIGAVARRPLRPLGAMLLALGSFGWVYFSTDTGGIIEARPVHVAFGVMFSLGWVALGLVLQARGTTRS